LQDNSDKTTSFPSWFFNKRNIWKIIHESAAIYFQVVNGNCAV